MLSRHARQRQPALPVPPAGRYAAGLQFLALPLGLPMYLPVPGTSYGSGMAATLVASPDGMAVYETAATGAVTTAVALGTSFSLLVRATPLALVGTEYSIIGADNGSSIRHFQFRFNASNQFEFIRFDTLGNAYLATSTLTAAIEKSYTIVATSDGAAMRLHVDGTLYASGTISNTPSDMDATVYWASRFGVDQFNGNIGLVAMFRPALPDGDAITLSRNVWELFKPHTRAYFLPSAGAAVQYAYPIADIAAGGWLPSSGSDLYAMIDEVTPDDADYDYTLLPGQTAKLQLTSITDPASSTGHKYRFRAYSAQSRTVQIEIYSGATLIKTTTQVLTAGVAQYEVTLSGAEADLIGNYADLEAWLTGVAPS